MQSTEYENWLVALELGAKTITTQMHRAGRVENYYGDLDTHFGTDRLASVIAALGYTKRDQSRNVPNPSRIPFVGDTYTNLASYRGAVKKYLRFKHI
jgi:hypothetical protein